MKLTIKEIDQRIQKTICKYPHYKNLCEYDFYPEDKRYLSRLNKLKQEETGIPVIIADDPLTCVARGGGMVLEMIDKKGTDFISLE